MILSLGEQQRIAFLRVIVNKPDVVFMDEVTSVIDESNEIPRVCKALCEENKVSYETMRARFGKYV